MGWNHWFIDKLGAASGGRDVMCPFVWGFGQPSLIWPLRNREGTCVICDFLGTLPWVSSGSPNVFGVDKTAPCSIWIWTTAGAINSVVPYFLVLSHRSSWPHLPKSVTSIRNASSASVDNAPCDPVPFWRLCPSPSRVCHLHPACPAQHPFHHDPRLPQPPRRWNLQDRSDYLQWLSTSPQILFQALWLSFPPFRHVSNLPAAAWLLSLRLQLTFLQQRSLYQHNHWSISPSLCWLKSSILLVSPPQASFLIATCAILQGLAPCQTPSRSVLHSLEDVVLRRCRSIFRIGLLVVAKSSFLEHWPLYCVLTLLMGDMLDVGRDGPHGGKLPLSHRGWYA